MSAEPVHTWLPFHNAALTPQQNKAVEMLYNGFTRAEIRDEMEISDRSLNRLFHNARKRGEPVPFAPPGRKVGDVPPSRYYVPIERLVQVRALFRAQGVESGLHRLIAESVGMKAGTVKVRLWKYDQKQGASR